MNSSAPFQHLSYEVDDHARVVAIARLQDLLGDGRVSLDRFSGLSSRSWPPRLPT